MSELASSRSLLGKLTMSVNRTYFANLSGSEGFIFFSEISSFHIFPKHPLLTKYDRNLVKYPANEIFADKMQVNIERGWGG